MAQLPRGTVTFVFTDIEGSTRLLTSLGSRYEEVLASHRALLREAFRSHGGVEVDTQGDAFFYAFSRARDAVEAVARAQRALENHPWPDGHQVRVRIGVHSGEPQATDEGYVGEDVHIGARIGSAAHGGQVLLSDATEGLLPGIIEGISLRDLGGHGLKDLSATQHLYQLVIEGLSNDFPPIRTLDNRPNNLPRQLTALIGRDHEVQETCSLLRRDANAILTLTGPGGTGKTRLALEVAAELLDDFPQGVFFVDLSSLKDPSLVVSTTASALSLRESPGRMLHETLEEYLSDKRMLLVLDNFEQVVGAAAQVFSLLASATELKLLITSREPLHIQGEREIPVPPLEVPTAETLEQVLSAPAVVLFVERAETVKPGFRLTQFNAIAVAEICRRLDGLPLAIELAASRTKLLSPDALLRRLDQSLKLLGGARRDGSERQRTLRNAIAWSYELLSDDEQFLFRRLGVFSGGWTLDAAEAVCDWGDPKLDVLDGLASLLDKSLIRVMGEDQQRFSMLETIRGYAAEKLGAGDEARETRRQHAEYFRRLAEAAEPHLVGRDEKVWLDAVEDELPNLREALRWWSQNNAEGAIGMAAALRRFWWSRGYLSEGRGWLEATSGESGHSTKVRAKALYALAFIAHTQGDVAAAQASGNEALRLYTELNDSRGAARVSDTLAMVAEKSGNYAQARSLYESSIVTWRNLGDKRGLFVSTANLGNLALLQGDYAGAIELTEQSLALAEEMEDTEGMAAALHNLGVAYLHLGSPEKALRFLQKSLVLAQELRHTESMMNVLIGVAATAGAIHKPETALRLLGAADKLCEATSTSLPPLEWELRNHTLDSVGTRLDNRAIAEGLRVGQLLSLDDALTEAAAVRGLKPSPPTRPAPEVGPPT